MATQDVTAALRYTPQTQQALKRSQYLSDALKTLQTTGGDIRGGWGELAAKLGAMYLYQRGSAKADDALVRALRGEQQAKAAKMGAEIEGWLGPQTTQALPPAYTPVPIAPPQVPVDRAPLPPAVPPQASAVNPDVDVAIKTVIGESLGEGPEGWKWVAGSLRNRVGKLGSYEATAKAPKQYSAWTDPKTLALMDKHPPGSEMYEKVRSVVEPILLGQVGDPTGGATNFINPSLVNPSWAQRLPQTRVGNHAFMRDPSQAAPFNYQASRPAAPQAQQAQNLTQPGPMQDQPFQVASNGPIQIPSAPNTGQLAPGNIDLGNRPTVRNPDGSISTVRSISINVDGKEVLIPTVTDDGRVVSDEEASQQFYRTGRHLGVFASPEAATAYAQQLHQQQAARYGGAPSAPASQPGGTPPGGAPLPQAGAPPGVTTWRPTQQQVSLVKQLLASSDPADVERGTAMFYKMQELAAQPVKMEATSINGVPAFYDPTNPLGTLQSAPIPGAMQNKTYSAEQLGIPAPPGTVLSVSPTGAISVVSRPEAGQQVVSGQGQPYREAPTQGGSKDPTSPLNVVAGEGKLRDDYEAQLKPYIVAREGYQKVVQAAGTGTPAGDIALVFGYMKTLDPTSTVREGEQASVRNSGTIDQTVANVYNQLLTGQGSLTPAQRAQYADSARRQFEVYDRTAQGLSQRYEKLARDYGYEPGRVIRQFDAIKPYEAPKPEGGAKPPDLVYQAYKSLLDKGGIDPKAPLGTEKNPFVARDPATAQRLDTPANRGKFIVMPDGTMGVIE